MSAISPELMRELANVDTVFFTEEGEWEIDGCPLTFKDGKWIEVFDCYLNREECYALAALLVSYAPHVKE